MAKSEEELCIVRHKGSRSVAFLLFCSVSCVNTYTRPCTKKAFSLYTQCARARASFSSANVYLLIFYFGAGERHGSGEAAAERLH